LKDAIRPQSDDFSNQASSQNIVVSVSNIPAASASRTGVKRKREEVAPERKAEIIDLEKGKSEPQEKRAAIRRNVPKS